MSLDKEIYRSLEDVLGPENISDDPVILDAYAWRSGMNSGVDPFAPRFGAVVLPGRTEEVQEVVRICNRHGLQFKASSTGWGFMNDPGAPGVVKIDLRRMNRILEINEEDMYAVVEPYVIGAQLQAELMKRGLTCNLTGAGGNCSVLPLAAHEGIGHMGQSMSYGERNQLAMEWVTPDGEVLRLGSLSATGDWFSGDGPGPSLRGIVRGNCTPLGGLGVYTKAALKLYHWPGPETFPVEGVSPDYAPAEIPEGMMIRYLSFKTMADRFEALRKIGESEIAFEIMGFAPSMVSANIARNNPEDLEYFERIKASVQGPGFQIIIVGDSENDFEYKKRVLELIMEETGGRSLDVLEDAKIGGGQMWRCIRITGSIRETMRATGVFGGVVGGTDQLELLTEYVQQASPYKAELMEKGLVLDDGSEPFIMTLEHGHFGHAELLIRYRPNPETMAGLGKLIEEGAFGSALKYRYGVPHLVGGDALHDLFGPVTSNYHLWLRKIKKAFDPNGISESTHHISNR
jgi:glycolate oxidase